MNWGKVDGDDLDKVVEWHQSMFAHLQEITGGMFVPMLNLVILELQETLKRAVSVWYGDEFPAVNDAFRFMLSMNPFIDRVFTKKYEVGPNSQNDQKALEQSIVNAQSRLMRSGGISHERLHGDS